MNGCQLLRYLIHHSDVAYAVSRTWVEVTPMSLNESPSNTILCLKSVISLFTLWNNSLKNLACSYCNSCWFLTNICCTLDISIERLTRCHNFNSLSFVCWPKLYNWLARDAICRVPSSSALVAPWTCQWYYDAFTKILYSPQSITTGWVWAWGTSAFFGSSKTCSATIGSTNSLLLPRPLAINASSE